MKKGIKQLTLCERVMNWSLENRNQVIPSSLEEHIHQCSYCQEFLKEEAWVNQTIEEQASRAPLSLSSDQFARVYQAIQDTSERLSAPSRQFFPWRMVVIAAITTCSVLLAGFWWLPLFNGETFLANRLNHQLRTIMQYEASVTEVANVSVLDSSLQFASQYL